VFPLLAPAHTDAGLPPWMGTAALAQWTFAPVVTALVAAAAAAYLWGVWRVARRHPARPWPWARTGSFLAGLAVIVIATQSSIGAYDDVLFWIHMVQHLLLIMVAPILLVTGRPATLALHASRNPAHRWLLAALHSRTISAITHPLVGLAAYAGTVVGTHLTSFMNLTLTNETIHESEHALYLVVGFLFFLPIVGGEPIRWRLSAPSRIGLLVLGMPVDTFTGVVLNQAHTVLFPAYLADRPEWAPTVVHDLHMGGLVMWVGGDWIMLVLILLGFAAWARASSPGIGRWLEAARRSAFDTHTGSSAPAPAAMTAPTDTIDDEDSLNAYNAWLGRLSQRGGSRR
jgi:putative copper resistance protein D